MSNASSFSSRLEELTTKSPTLLAWSMYDFNNISVIELETKQNNENFEGSQIQIGKYILYFEANPTIPSILRLLDSCKRNS